MRLGQLARKISIRQVDIVDFLAKSDVVISNESNARLDDDHVKIILGHFAPSFLEEKVEDNEVILVEDRVEEVIAISVPTPIIEEKEVVQEAELSEVPDLSTGDQKEEKIEVIKAPKVDLPGLKVIGKIDLPEPKKKEVSPSEEVEKVEVEASNSGESAKPRTQSPREINNNRRERTNRSVNPIALQRERDARAAEEKRKENAIKEKEKRTEYYQKRVKVTGPTKATRLFNEPVEEFISPKKEEAKTILGKIFNWFTNA